MSKIYFIAETAFSHQGCEGYMSSLVDEIIDSDADVVKFQVLLESEYSLDHAMAHKCRELMFPKLYWRHLVSRVRASGKKVLILPADYQALVWVVSEGLADILEIHSAVRFIEIRRELQGSTVVFVGFKGDGRTIYLRVVFYNLLNQMIYITPVIGIRF